MNREKLDELWIRLIKYRELQATVSSQELEAFAEDIGRVRDKNGFWISPNFTDHRPILIPNEPGESQLDWHTSSPILLELEDDLFAIDEMLKSYEEHKNEPIN